MRSLIAVVSISPCPQWAVWRMGSNIVSGTGGGWSCAKRQIISPQPPSCGETQLSLMKAMAPSFHAASSSPWSFSPLPDFWQRPSTQWRSGQAARYSVYFGKRMRLFPNLTWEKGHSGPPLQADWAWCQEPEPPSRLLILQAHSWK